MRSLLTFMILTIYQALAASAGQIHEAARNGDVAAVVAALEQGADVDDMSGGGTPLFFAAARGHLDAAKLLVARGADVNIMSKYGSALMAAANRTTPELVVFLLASGADPNADLNTKTALHVAAERGCLGCVMALVAAGADVNAQHRKTEIYGGCDPPSLWFGPEARAQQEIADRYDRHYVRMTTPLHLAILSEHEDVADYLRAHGVIIPNSAPIAAKLASADLIKGLEVLGSKCRRCHAMLSADGADEIVDDRGRGPSLWNVVGRLKASASYKGYSKTLQSWKGDWSYEDLNAYLAGPAVAAPGGYMQMEGVPNEADRINLIAFLRTLSDDPVPLP